MAIRKAPGVSVVQVNVTCDKCNNFVCKAYKATCFKYRIKNFFKNLLTKR